MNKTTHKDQIASLRRAAGQITGVQKMMEEEKYCIDIIIQIHAAINALYRVSEKVFAKHLESCVQAAFSAKGSAEKKKKINEIVDMVTKLHKL
jgi:DNA-binding FrmR family transcriptional regulator